MPRKSSELSIVEMPGNQYPDLQTAQKEALTATADDLASTIRRLLMTGRLVNVNGKIIPPRS